ncbi:MAG: Crp/Fnr family transcriptional regulator [Alphaproteobacteria bacterium]|nr:Crp/Fnr family transcriptional regulator [Alphaproteobacteria bacterium]
MQEVMPSGLTAIELFADMPPAQVQALEERCVWRRYDRNELILDRDSESRDVFFVAEGQVQVKNYSYSGREIALATIRTGGYFGELSAIDNERRSATVLAAEECLLAAMTPGVFGDLLATQPAVALMVLRRLARIIRVCDERILDLSTLGAVQRVYVELLRLAGPDAAVPSLRSIYPMPTQAEVAGRASTTRETVARVIGQLSQAAIVERKGKTLYIKKPDDLETLAERLRPDETESASR